MGGSGEDMVNRKRQSEQVKDRGCESLLPADRGNEGVHCTVHCTQREEAASSCCKARAKIKSVSVFVCARVLVCGAQTGCR